MTDEIYVKVVPLPGKVHGFTHVEPDGSYTVVVNENDSEARRMKAYQHEVDHIRRGDFDRDADVQQVEMEAHDIAPVTPERMPSKAFEAMMAGLEKRRKEAARRVRTRRKWEKMMGLSEDERFARYENCRLEE